VRRPIEVIMREVNKMDDSSIKMFWWGAIRRSQQKITCSKWFY
jgi:hypothetical protein